jgi:xylitol oxidase
MNKREFLKASGAIITGTMLSRVAPAELTTNTDAHRTNWSGNLTYHTDHLLQPTSVEEVQQAVKGCTRLRALGARHSFNTIADSRFDQISVKALNHMTVDAKARTVTVGGGVTYGDVSPWLDAQGFALHNLASLTQVSVAGACATATHGSGNKNQNLSSSVAAMEIVTADGNLVPLSREKDGDPILGAAVALGGLGVVTSTTLDVIPRFDMAQVVFENLSFDQLEHNLEAIFGSGYSVSLFTDWQKNRATQVWIKSRLAPGGKADMPTEFYGATLAKQKLHPITGASAVNCTDQLGIPGPWYDRMPHFRIHSTPSSGHELQSEYFVPREKGYAAIRAVEELRDHITPHLFVTEFRTIAADNLWMSTCHDRDSMTIHFTWKPDWPSVKKVLPLIEAKLAPFGVRPHWAKMFTMQPSDIQKQYQKLSDYQAMVKHYDPNGKFLNDFLNTNLFGA